MTHRTDIPKRALELRQRAEKDSSPVTENLVRQKYCDGCDGHECDDACQPLYATNDTVKSR